MKTFLRRLAIFSIFPIAAAVLTFLRADGRTDAYYLRFTTPRQTSLILGTSRAAQGIRPRILDSVLHVAGRDVRSFNYSFAIGLSNYGPVYLRSILKKLDPSSVKGVFVLTVDPWSIAGPFNAKKHYAGEDDRSFLASMDCVNMDPNIEYLLTAYDKPLLRIVLPDPRQPTGQLTLHEDGWLEVDLPMSPAAVEKRTVGKLKEYRQERFPGTALSAMRAGYLAMTIDTLKQHGTVLLVRLPVGPRMQALEDSLAPHFSGFMDKLSRSKGVGYLDMTAADKPWEFTDGHHLASPSGTQATITIAEHLAHKAPPG